ncbi:HAD family hydrolase [Paenibacillus sp. GCM10027627]|uniref:HAD family hydrolase n=1 Tax=unclassified Paenibacillus TaxID=185978 RepID=UPI00363C2FAE
MSIKTNYESVQEFHHAFSYSMPTEPTAMSKEMILNRMSFDAEETIEILHATCSSKKELKKLYKKLMIRMESSLKKQLKKEFPQSIREKLVAQTDGLLDKKYFNNGDFTLVSLNPDPLFEIVHNANMNKLHSDGKPRYDEYGKIIKPEGWVAPEPLLEAEIQRQIESAQQ